MKNIKTDARNRLHVSSLTDCMRVNLDSPGIFEFDPLRAICHWLVSGARSRRPNYNRQQAVSLIKEVIPGPEGETEAEALAALPVLDDLLLATDESPADNDSDNDSNFSEISYLSDVSEFDSDHE